MRKSVTFAIHTLGCKVNTYESDAIAQSMRAAGFIQVPFEDTADIYIINTCTVTNIADRKSRQMLRRARKLNPDAVIAAAGCYVDDAIKNEKLEDLIKDGVIDIAVPNKDKADIVRIISEGIESINRPAAGTAENGTGDVNINIDRKEPDSGAEEAAYKASDKDAAEGKEGGNANEASEERAAAEAGSGVAAGEYDSRFLTELDGHSRAFIKVQDGCNMFCSYCIIPYVRGKLRARPAEEVLEEVRRLGDNGVAEVVLTGIHLSSLKDGLLELVEGIERIDSIKRVRLGSLEPTLITEGFVSRAVKCSKLCPHFHLSLQSGSDEILKRMNRHYTTKQYEESCDILRHYYDHPAITTDIIVGFPGETGEHFRQTCEFVKRIGFYEAHVFKYSRRRGTPADRMDGQLTDAEKSRRSDELTAITAELSSEFRHCYIGRSVEFLSEELIEIEGEAFETGYTPEYVRCIKPSPVLHQNVILRGKGSEIVQQNDIDGTLLLV